MNASTRPTSSTTGESGGDSSGDGSGDGPSPSSNSRSSADSTASPGDADQPPEPEPNSARAVIDLTIDRAVDRRIDFSWLSAHTEQAATRLREHAPSCAFTHVAVTVVNDERMAELHRRHCNVDATTDVLTFVVSSPNEPIEAEIAVCADEAARRADEFGYTIERELLLYILHGMLHCCGFNDHDSAGFARMHETEDAILEAIGVGSTFKKHQNAETSKRQARGMKR